eukprot:gene8526-10265_t
MRCDAMRWDGMGCGVKPCRNGGTKERDVYVGGIGNIAEP